MRNVIVAALIGLIVAIALAGCQASVKRAPVRPEYLPPVENRR